MMTILSAIYFDLASLAEAAYAIFRSDIEPKQSLIDSGFSESQASDLLSRWSVIHDGHNAGAGYSSTLFESADGYVLAFRGTAEFTNDLISADVLDIVADGVAIHQIIDMVNEWSRINASGIYSEAKLVTLDAQTLALQTLGAAYLPILALQNDVIVDLPTNTVKTIVWENSTTNGLGLADAIAAKGLTVTGHSLGGHLAAAFTRLIPDVGAEALTVNGAGFGVLGLNGFASKNVSNLFTMLFGEPDFNEANVLNLYGEKNPEFITQDVLLQQPGASLPIFIEQPGFWDNKVGHSSKPMTDTLAVYDLFFRMEKNVQLNNLLTIFNNSSAEAATSLEMVVKLLGKVFNIGLNPFVRDDRESLHANIDAIRKSQSFTNIADKALIKAHVNVNAAYTNFGQFLSLYFALPFVIEGVESDLSNLHADLYASWSADQNLSAEDRKNGKANFSDEWYQDSAAYLRLLMERNENDIDKLESSNPDGKDGFYIKVENDDNDAHHIFSGSTNASNYSQEPAAPRIILGTINDNDNATRGGDGNDRIYGLGGDDILNGLKGHDVLIAGAGKDQLIGGEGDDLLIGGEGTDAYIFDGDFGTDRIIDSDGKGSITINGVVVSSLKPVQGAENVFRINDDIEAIQFSDGTTNNLIIFSRSESSGNGSSVLIKNWQENDLGISVAESETQEFDANTSGVFNGDGVDNAIDIYDFRKTLPDGTDSSAIINLVSNGGGGRDLLQGWLNGSDTLDGGDGNDFIIGGNQINGSGTYLLDNVELQGTDVLSGGAGQDYIVVSGKNSVAHGGADNDFIRADELWNIKIREYEADGSVSATDLNDVNRNQVWSDFGRFLSPNYSETSPGLYSLSPFDRTKTNPNWVPDTSVTGLPYYYLQREGYSSANSIVATIHYGDSAPAFGTNPVTGGWTIEGGFQIDFVSTNVKSYEILPEAYAIYQNQSGFHLYGDEGDDVIFGSIKSDIIFGGADNDTVWGFGGHDFIDGGDGADEIRGGLGNDTIVGGAGNDVISGSGETATDLDNHLPDNDAIYAGEGNDTVYGGDGDDYIEGGAGADILFGGKGNDILVADVDDLYLKGDDGDDLYIIENIAFEENAILGVENSGNSNSLAFTGLEVQGEITSTPSTLFIARSEGNNTLALAGVNNLNQVFVAAVDNDLTLNVGNSTIYLEEGLNGGVSHIGVGMSASQLKESHQAANTVTMNELLLTRLTTAVTRTAQTAGTQLAGGLGNDVLIAHAGGSTLIGGVGNDAMTGGLGDDTYIIRAGDGSDTITEGGGNNTITFASGISSNQIVLHRNAGDLLIVIATNQTIVIKGMFDEITGNPVPEKEITGVQFDDGEMWDSARILLESSKGIALTGSNFNDVLTAYDSADTLIGSAGNDVLQGGGGDDRYAFSRGHGTDKITDSQGYDHIYFAEDITESQIVLARDNNNLVVRINASDSIIVQDAFDVNGQFSVNAIEEIRFANTVVWDLQRIQSELDSNKTFTFIGTEESDRLIGDNVNQTFIGGLGDDYLAGGNADNIFEYKHGDGNDVIQDAGGIDKLLLTDINSTDVSFRRTGDDVLLTIDDGQIITIKHAFAPKAANLVDPKVLDIIDGLQNRWLSQAESLIETYYGLVGSGSIALDFEHNPEDSELAHVESLYSEGGVSAESLTLTINLARFGEESDPGIFLYPDRVIAHELVHAVMAKNMNTSILPGWFNEGVAEFIHGADERVRANLAMISNQVNFNTLFKTSVGSPALSAGYAVSYIAVKLLDKEIRDHGGAGISLVFDQLKNGNNLSDSLALVSGSLGGVSGLWNDLASFESHFLAEGYSGYQSLLNLYDLDTGSIAGSDYGNSPLSAEDIVPDANTGPSKNFNLVIPEQFIPSAEINGAIENIVFADGVVLTQEQIIALLSGELIEGTDSWDDLVGTEHDDTLIGGSGNDSLRGGMGNDTYIFRPYDGNDTIFEMGGANVIQFEPYVERDENNEITLIREIKPEDIKLRKMYGTALVLETTQGVSVTLWNMFNSSTGALNANDSISSIRFSNSEAWDYARMQQEMLRFTEYNDRIEGFDFATGLSGGEGYDTLIGYGGDDTLEGGRGNDTLDGGNGNDTYLINLGDGFDNINEQGGFDTIQLGEGISLGDVKISSVSGSSSSQNVMILLPNNHYITVWGMFNAAENNFNSAYAIDFIRFHNGDSLDSAQMLQLLLNPQKNRIEDGAGDNLLVGQLDHDYLVGNKGNDTLQGGAGDDDYYFSVGDGRDVVIEQSGNDRILLGEGYSPETVRIFRSDHRLVIKSLISSDEISVNNYFMESGAVNSQSIEKIVFANGLEWGSLLIKQNLYTQATQGDDVIYGVDTNELFNGLAGNDYINSGGGNDTLNGGDGNDTLIAGVGTSILVGGTGNDVMSAGAATYKFSLGDGIDVIKSGSTRKIEFDTSVLPVAVTLQQSGKHLLLKYSESDSILIENMFGDYRYKDSTIEIKFSGGVTWSWDTVKNKISYGADEANNIIYGVSSLHERIDGAGGNDTIYGGFGIDTLLGGDGDDVIYGGDSVGGKYIYYGADLGDELLGGGGNDRLYGEAGNDLLDGGSGQDSLYGGAGNDTYVGGDGNDNLTDDSATSNDSYLFAHGHGRDSISDSGGSDSLVFDETISNSNLSIRNTYSGLLFSTGSGSSIVDKNYAIDSIVFFNNESWNRDKVYVEALKPGSDNREEIGGFNSDDIITGNKGDDLLHGGAGNDTYMFSSGDGDDSIRELQGDGLDTILLAEGLVSSDIVVIRRGENLVLTLNSGDSIYVWDQFINSTDEAQFNSIERLVFSDGEEWDAARLVAESKKNNAVALTFQGEAFAEHIIGTYLDDSLAGNGGDDWIHGGVGNDMITGGDGIDTLIGGLDNDTLMGGAGNDYLLSGAGNDRLDGGEGDDVYYYDLGDGEDTLVLSSGRDRIVFGPGIGVGDVTFRRNALLIGGDKITLEGLNPEVLIEFSDGTILDWNSIYSLSLLGTSGKDSIQGYASDDVIDAGDGNDIVWGMDGNDTLISGAGLDTLYGNDGNDILISSPNLGNPLFINGLDGGRGDDTYLIQLESGKTVITEGMQGNGITALGRGNAAGGVDLIQLPAGITEQDVSVRVSRANYGSDLTRALEIALSSGDVITVRGMFEESLGQSYQSFSGQLDSIGVIETIRFDNNTEWDINRILQEAVKGSDAADHISGFDTAELIAGLEGNDTIYSGGGNDTIVGGVGDDFLMDRQGDEVYRFARGDGKDTIQDSYGNDSIYFEGDITLADISAKRSDLSWAEPNNQMGESLIISLNTGESVEIMGVFSAGLNEVNDNAVIENFYFENGSSITFSALLNSISGFEVDITPPDIPTAVFDAFGTTITGASEVSSIVTVKDTDGNVLGNATADIVNGTYSVTLATALINNEIVNVTATDAAGNISAINAIIAPDKTAPTAPTANLDTTSKIVNGIAEAGSSVAVQDSTGQTLGVVQANAATGAYSVSFTQTLINGQSIFTTATDTAGNISAATATPIVINTDPQPAGNGLRGSYYGYHQSANGNVNLTNVAQIRTIIASKAPDASFIAKDFQYGVVGAKELGMGTTLQTFLKTDAASLSVDPANTSDAILKFDGKIQLDAGSYNFRVRADDGYSILVNGAVVAEFNGNQGATTRTHATFAISQSGLHDIEIVYWDAGGGAFLNVELANTATGIYNYLDASILFNGVVTSPDTTSPLTPDADFDLAGKVISGTAENGSLVEIKTSSGDLLGNATADIVNGTYSVTLATALINNEIVNVTAQDAAGNISAINAIIAPDKTAPAAPTANLDTAAKIVNGIAEVGSGVTVQDSTGQTLGVVQADATTGAYSVSFTQTLINGQSIFTTATDTAGNISAATATPIVINTDPQPAGNGLRGSYYGYHQSANGNIDLSNVAQVRTIISSKAPDAAFIAKDFQYGVVGAKELGMGTTLQTFLKTDAASLSVDPANTSDAILKFDGKIQLDAGSYNFRVRADDGYSILVNGAVVAEFNGNQGATTRTHATFTITQSGLHDIEIVYWDAGGGAFLNVELADTATGAYSYINQDILFQPMPIEPVAIVSTAQMSEADYERVHYFNRNDALIQAMATFVSESGVDTRYRAAHFDQSALMLAVGS